MRTIRLKNVKAFVDTNSIEIAPITIFVGRNSSGKSTFIRFPAVLSQTFKSGTDSPISLHGQQENYIDYGNFDDVLHNHSGECFSIELEYPINIEKLSSDMPFVLGPDAFYGVDAQLPDMARIQITYSEPQDMSRIFATKIELHINEFFFSSFEYESYNKETDLKYYRFTQKQTIKGFELKEVDYSFTIGTRDIENYMPKFDTEDYWTAICSQIQGIKDEEKQLQLYKEIVRPWARARLFTAIKSMGEDIDADGEESLSVEKQSLLDAYQSFEISAKVFRIIYNCMRLEFQNLRYIGPFRSSPSRVYRQEEIAISEVGKKGDYTSSLLINDKKLNNSVSKWFKDTMEYSLSVQEIGEDSGFYQLFAEDKNGNKSNIMDVGYGISQVLPIVTQIMKAKQGSSRKRKEADDEKNALAIPEIIVIEQPELHLHPAAQSELAVLFASAVDGLVAKNRRLLIETHSEHLIRKLQVMIAQEQLTKEMVKVYYVDRGENGNSQIKEMKINELGQFEDVWPSGFFDKAYELSKQLLIAAGQRKQH